MKLQNADSYISSSDDDAMLSCDSFAFTDDSSVFLSDRSVHGSPKANIIQDSNRDVTSQSGALIGCSLSIPRDVSGDGVVCHAAPPIQVRKRFCLMVDLIS